MAERAITGDLVARVVTDFGGLDILASNAGAEHFGSLESITDADFDCVFGVEAGGRLHQVVGNVAAPSSPRPDDHPHQSNG